MRTGAPDEVLSGAAGYWPVVSSWLGGRLLADHIPVLSGRVTATVTQEVPERLTLRVPRWDGRDWLPGTDPAHPLARFGQELSVSVVVWSAVRGVEYETRVGRYLVTDWDYDDTRGVVALTAVGLLQRVADDRLVTPLAPRTGGTFVSEARRLLPPGMSAGFDPALVDRACPTSMEWAEDRLAALYEIADAWPARLRIDQWGQVRFLPPLTDVPDPVVRLTDGERGTVVAVDRSDTRAQGYNRVVARSSAPGLEAVQAIADTTAGPLAVTSDYGVVARFFSSPLITTVGQAAASAETIRRSSLLPTCTIPVTCAPDPRLDLDDPTAVTRDGVTDWGWVTGYDLPLTVADGPMRLDVGVAA